MTKAIPHLLQRLGRSFAEQSRPVGVLYRFLMPAIGLAFLVAGTWLHLQTRPESRQFGWVVVPVALILNHLAYFWTWPLRSRVVLRICAWVWLLVGGVYICHLLPAR